MICVICGREHAECELITLRAALDAANARVKEFQKMANCCGVLTDKTCSVDGHRIYGAFFSNKDGSNVICEFHGMKEALDKLTTERDNLLADKQRLREALEPFSAPELLANGGDLADDVPVVHLKVTVGHCRNAARVLESTK